MEPLRPLLLARTFDLGGTIDAFRRVSETITAYRSAEEVLGGCVEATDLARRVGILRATAVAALERSQAARITSAEVHRSVAADLYGLLPEVIALSAAGESLADSLGVQVAQVTDGNGKPIGSLAPLPTPKPTPRPTPTPAPPKVADIKATFFGSGVKTSKYKVSGNTPSEISRSIAKHGPFSDWIGGRAAALTKPSPKYRFHFEVDGYGACRIVAESKPAITISYTIVLARWTAPSGTSSTTIRWWNADIRATAKHEKVHVDIYRSAAKRLNTALASSTCANAQRRLNTIMKDARRKNCEFDMAEYGAAAGLSLKKCLAQ